MLELPVRRHGRRPGRGAAAPATVVSADDDPPRRRRDDGRRLPVKREHRPTSVPERRIDPAAPGDLTDRPVVSIGTDDDRAAVLPRRHRVHPQPGVRSGGEPDRRHPFVSELTVWCTEACDGMENDRLLRRIVGDCDQGRTVRHRPACDDRVPSEPSGQASAAPSVTPWIRAFRPDDELRGSKGDRAMARVIRARARGEKDWSGE
jgi:hypothetical protein